MVDWRRGLWFWDRGVYYSAALDGSTVRSDPNNLIEKANSGLNDNDCRYRSLPKLLPIDTIKPVLGQHNCLDSLFANFLHVRHGKVLRI